MEALADPIECHGFVDADEHTILSLGSLVFVPLFSGKFVLGDVLSLNHR